MPHQGTAPAQSAEESIVARLAKFFPEATPLRIGVTVTGSDERKVRESTVIEFGTPREVLFAVAEPLAFGDTVHIRNSDGSLCADAVVVAVQYHNNRTALAARFTTTVSNWIVKL